MAQPDETTPLALGFLTILRDADGYLGGYLATNRWGRPLEFRLTTAVKPNRVQQVLYGDTLEAYLCADLLGAALIKKATTEVHLLLTDTEAALDLRCQVPLPIGWLPNPSAAAREVLCHRSYPGDQALIRNLLSGVDAAFVLSEPFGRIREAIAEARKMGVTNRAA